MYFPPNGKYLNFSNTKKNEGKDNASDPEIKKWVLKFSWH